MPSLARQAHVQAEGGARAVCPRLYQVARLVDEPQAVAAGVVAGWQPPPGQRVGDPAPVGDLALVTDD